MADNVASTAYGPMVLVALERTLPEIQRIVDDPLAYQMLPAYMKLMVNLCELKPLRQMFFNMMEKNMPGMRNGFPSRKRYINDKMADIVAANIETMVILGAGLDSLAYRIPELSKLRVYEVDLPENIRYKRQKLEALYGIVPAHVTLVPVNFEDRNLEDALRQAGYSFDHKTAFVWEAVTQYLTEAAVRDTFSVLAKAVPGSRLLFTYVLKEFIDGTNTYGLDSLYQRFRVKSQVWQFGLHSHEVANFIGEYGWQVIEDAGAAEHISRYLKPAGRMEPVAAIERIVYVEKTMG